eukprot:6210305-Pleurochrysis_carterae.AAC.2
MFLSSYPSLLASSPLYHQPVPPLPLPPFPPPPWLGPAPSPPLPLPPLCHACIRSFLSSSSAISLSAMRVSPLRRLHGKNLHLGFMNRQFPRYGRNSRQTVCVRMALSSFLSTSLAPSAPLATSSHAARTASSCACRQRRRVNRVFWLRCLLLCSRRRLLPFSPGDHLLLASGLLSTILHQFLTVLPMRPCAQLAPPPLLVERQRSPHRVVCACCVRFHLERSFMVSRVQCELGGAPAQLFPGWCRVSELAFVSRRARLHAPHVDI